MTYPQVVDFSMDNFHFSVDNLPLNPSFKILFRDAEHELHFGNSGVEVAECEKPQRGVVFLDVPIAVLGGME